MCCILVGCVPHHLRGHFTSPASASAPTAYANIHPPFDVWTETPTEGAVNFITGLNAYRKEAGMKIPSVLCMQNEPSTGRCGVSPNAICLLSLHTQAPVVSCKL